MGMICCKVKEEYLTIETESKSPIKIPFPVFDKSQKSIPSLEASKLPSSWISLMGIENITKFIKEDIEESKKPSNRNDSAKILDVIIEPFHSNYRMWVTITPLENGDNLHNYSHMLEYPFTPDLFYLFSLQEKLTGFRARDDSVDFFEIIYEEITEEYILTVTKTITKKILIIKPRTFFVVRVLRRVGKNECQECTRSVELTELKKLPIIIQMMTQATNVGRVLNGDSNFVEDDDRYVFNTFTKTDILSSVGLGVVKVTLKKKFSVYFTNWLKEQLDFLLKYKNRKELIWFKGKESEIDEIFNDNFKRLNALKRNLSGIDPVLEKLMLDNIKENEKKDRNSGTIEKSKPVLRNDDFRAKKSSVNSGKDDPHKTTFKDLSHSDLKHSLFSDRDKSGEVFLQKGIQKEKGNLMMSNKRSAEEETFIRKESITAETMNKEKNSVLSNMTEPDDSIDNVKKRDLSQKIKRILEESKEIKATSKEGMMHRKRKSKGHKEDDK